MAYMKLPVTELVAGSTIAMLGGVVKVDDVFTDIDEIVVLVSIGNLKRHPLRFAMDAEVETVNMPNNLRGWYGV